MSRLWRRYAAVTDTSGRALKAVNHQEDCDRAIGIRSRIDVD